MDHLSKEWALKSLTIGPQSNETNAEFWEEAFRGLPPLPSVDNVAIICNYPSARAFNTDCWKYFDRLLTRRDLFPALKSVDVQSSFGSQQLSHRRWLDISASLRTIKREGLWPRRQPVEYTGPSQAAARAYRHEPCKFFAPKRDHRTDSPYKI